MGKAARKFPFRAAILFIGAQGAEFTKDVCTKAQMLLFRRGENQRWRSPKRFVLSIIPATGSMMTLRLDWGVGFAVGGAWP
jgi:hypothetical protein